VDKISFLELKPVSINYAAGIKSYGKSLYYTLFLNTKFIKDC